MNVTSQFYRTQQPLQEEREAQDAMDVQNLAFTHLRQISFMPGLLPEHRSQSYIPALSYLSSLIANAVPKRIPGDTAMMTSTIVDCLGIEMNNNTAFYSGNLTAAVERMLDDVARGNDKNMREPAHAGKVPQGSSLDVPGFIDYIDSHQKGMHQSVGDHAVPTLQDTGVNALNASLKGINLSGNSDMYRENVTMPSNNGVGGSSDQYSSASVDVNTTVKSLEDSLPDDASLLDDRDLLGFCLPESIDDLPNDVGTNAGLSLNASAPSFLPRKAMQNLPQATHTSGMQSPYVQHDLHNYPHQQPQHPMHGSPPGGASMPFSLGGAQGDKQYQTGDMGQQQEFNDAIQVLQANAPGYDIDSLISIFVANDYDVALTLDVIAHLEIDGGLEETKVASQPAPVLNELNFPSLGASTKNNKNSGDFVKK